MSLEAPGYLKCIPVSFGEINTAINDFRDLADSSLFNLYRYLLNTVYGEVEGWRENFQEESSYRRIKQAKRICEHRV